MRAVILAGGIGSRLSEETTFKPKPLVEIGGKPIIWHIMKIYSSYGINEFIICCGYKGFMIKEYFMNYSKINSDVEVDLRNGNIKVLKKQSEKWKIKLIDTGLKTMTGGRIKRLARIIKPNETFCLTYGDGLADINIKKLIKFHKKNKKLATISAVYPDGRFGALKVKDSLVKEFQEKPRGDGNLINGGFFVLNSKVLKFIKDDDTIWEQAPLQELAKINQLSAYNHKGFWQPMDSLRDKNLLENLVLQKKAPWIKW